MNRDEGESDAHEANGYSSVPRIHPSCTARSMLGVSPGHVHWPSVKEAKRAEARRDRSKAGEQHYRYRDPAVDNPAPPEAVSKWRKFHDPCGKPGSDGYSLTAAGDGFKQCYAEARNMFQSGLKTRIQLVEAAEWADLKPWILVRLMYDQGDLTIREAQALTSRARDASWQKKRTK